MNKLETVIFNSLEKFKNSQLSLYSKVTRQYLAMEIASGIKEKIEKERLNKEVESRMKGRKEKHYSKEDIGKALINIMNLADKERQEKECN